jgi:hypothetical protein
VSNAERAFTVDQARALWAAGYQALEARKQEINDLNVYPVPDGDTGTNLALTVRGIVDVLGRLPQDLGQVELCAAVSQAALMGARGNSGVILSQIVRGAMEVLGRPGPVTVDILVRALRHATETAYRAVRRPVEGTMLTVLREMAEAASEVSEDADMRTFLDGVIGAGWRSVEKTPTLLKVLADAGVVDAGGFGLVVLVEGAANGRAGGEVPIALRWAQTPEVEIGAFEEPVEPESPFTYCTSFLLTGVGLDPTALEQRLAVLGDSLLVVGNDSQVKVHVHTDQPGEVLGIVTALGVLTEIEIDNMKEQTAARTARLGRTAAVPAPAGPAGPAQAEGGLTQVVAVVSGEGNKELFRNLGVDLLVEGGQSMNPSTEDLMRAIEQATAPSVIVLPNNSNVIMTAEQTVDLADRQVLVVPSRSIQAGLSAAVALDKRSAGDVNAREMRSVIDSVITGEITRAVRDSLVDGVQVRAGEFIGLVDERVVVASPDIGVVVEEVSDRLLGEGREMFTVLLGDDEHAPLAAAAIERLRQRYPGVEIDIHQGGQPFYPVLLSAE